MLVARIGWGQRAVKSDLSPMNFEGTAIKSLANLLWVMGEKRNKDNTMI